MNRFKRIPYLQSISEIIKRSLLKRIGRWMCTKVNLGEGLKVRSVNMLFKLLLITMYGLHHNHFSICNKRSVYIIEAYSCKNF